MEPLPWRAACPDTRESSEQALEATATDEDTLGTHNRLASAAADRDNTALNSLQVPEDAGVYADGLRRILARIPDGWGRWISHESGWYPLITDCDHRLSELDANYVVHQVKEKFGTLRYYCEPSVKTRSAQADSFRAIIVEAERTSATTCERCGQRGQLCNRKYWLKTLCDSCAQFLGYEKSPSGADNDD